MEEQETQLLPAEVVEEETQEPRLIGGGGESLIMAKNMTENLRALKISAESFGDYSALVWLFYREF